MILKNLSLLVFLFLALQVRAQDHYSAQVDPITNNITVNWHDVQPLTTANYVVYWGIVFGTWDGNSGSLPPAAYSSYVCSPQVNAAASKYYIRIQRNPLSGPAEFIDFQSIRLQVTVVNAGLAKLDWNAVSNSEKGIYYIDRKSTAGWQLLASLDYNAMPVLNNFSLFDTISKPYCDPAGIDLTYRVRFIIDASSYTESISNEVTEGPFYDLTDPKDVINDTVSQYADGTISGIVIGWTQPPGKDIEGYMIQRSDIIPAKYDSIAFVPYGTNFFVDQSVSACLKNYGYAVITIDKCGKRSPGTYLPNHRKNIILSDFSIDGCERIAHLKWTAYHGMPGGLSGYQVFMSEAGKPFQLITTVPPADTVFNHNGLFKDGFSYKYFIRAMGASLSSSSSSCQKITTYAGTLLPDSIVITQATVVNEAHVKVNFLLYPDNIIKNLQLERADSREGPYSVVNSIVSSGFILEDYYIYDSTASVNSKSYYYRLAYKDGCSELPIYSVDTVRTILLQCKETEAGSHIEWNAWEQFNMGISDYTIFRTIGVTTSILSNVSPSQLDFNDDLAGVDVLQEVCYSVKANENPGNPQVDGAFSQSNTCCLKRSPKVLLPNAFRPEGENNILLPVCTNVDAYAFSMAIYNKWGEKVFETTNKDLGWTGRAHGSAAPMGVYFYLVKYRSLTGENFEKKGHVILLQ